jgi:hypothetical protein
LIFGKRGATWIFYSWFVAGVLGLTLSLYGLTGVEASMLMEPTWNVGDATRLMLHADNTWSGPGGWLKTIKWTVGSRSGGRRRSPSWLWFALALPSMLVFLAWPLSGLTMEVTQGYYHASSAIRANMTGFFYDTFNERDPDEAYVNAALLWRSGQVARIPGQGIIYTPEGFDRSQAAFLKQVPAVLPKDDGVPTMFLAAQSDNPTEGNIWGLLLQYKCSIVDKAEDFHIINKVHNSTSSDSRSANDERQVPRANDHGPRLLKDGKVAVYTLNQTDGSWAENLDAVADFGFEVWPSNKTGLPLTTIVAPHLHDCYLNIFRNDTGDYPGIHQEQIFELGLWQRLRRGYISNETPLRYDFSIDHTVKGYNATHDVRDFRGLSAKDYRTSEPLPMTAIGVQCRASSSLGSADINGVKSTYSNFQRTDTPMSKVYDTFDRCARRFNAAVPYQILTHWTLGPQWLSSLFKSSDAPPRFYGHQFSGLEVLDFFKGLQKSNPRVQLGYLQAEQLRRSLLHAYASYAVSLMYNGEQAYTTQNGSQLTFLSPNATEFQSGQVIKPGVMPAIIPLALFGIWALVSSALGIVYGFRRRWTETLDGHTMFRIGAELTDHHRRELLKTTNIVVKKEDCVALDDIPGLVGDTKPEIWPGRIGLVKEGRADKKKLYE